MTVRAEIRLAQPADRAAVLGLMEDFCGVEGKRFDVAVARAGLDPLLESDRYGAAGPKTSRWGQSGCQLQILSVFSAKSCRSMAVALRFVIVP